MRITRRLVVAGTYAKTTFYTSSALVSFFMRKHLHFLLPSEGEAKNSFFSPPPTFLLVLLLAAGFFSAASALAICKQFTAAPLPFSRYLLG